MALKPILTWCSMKLSLDDILKTFIRAIIWFSVGKLNLMV